ncbi:MAG: copper ABC transporter ATP-binding protein [Saprospirales bacterium]|nr:copper ABC transporter ATP-binding protein [Saprospirales bacterium]
MIEITGLHKSFGKNHVLKGVELSLVPPGLIAILGPNGSGKTTLIKSILGMVIPDRGEIEVDGASIKKAWEYRRQISYLPQIARFPENIRVRELIAMVKDLRGETEMDVSLISYFGLQPFLDKKLGNLSGGTRQKVNLVLCFMYDCPIVILDEPTAGLDPVSLVRLKKLIKTKREEGKLILITTHVMDLVEELAEEVVYLLEGNIHFRGTVAELKEKYQGRNVEESIAALLQKDGPFSLGAVASNGHAKVPETLLEN